MPDPRFFDPPEPISAADLAKTFGLSVEGDSARRVAGAAPLHLAGTEDLSFLATKSHLAVARTSAAGMLVLPKSLASEIEGPVKLLSEAPLRDYARIVRHLYPEPAPAPKNDVPAIDPSAEIAASAEINPGAVIGPGAAIGEASVIGPGAVIGRGVVIGKECRIGPRAVISHAILGDGVRILAGAAIGEAGFGYAEGPAGLEPIPQLGRVMLGDRVDIGAGTTIDRGAGDDTVIGTGTKIDNLVQIGHNCRIGAHCVVVSQAGISGSVTIGDGVQIGGKAGIADHLTIGSGAKVTAGAGVIRDVPPGEIHGGYPAQRVRDWHRQTVALARLGKPGR
ncbi:MAG: UDP-3-O-(3-hydroxymyristoyl)glucosamine N-acyltransferase [Pseudomonadota bacterium]